MSKKKTAVTAYVSDDTKLKIQKTAKEEQRSESNLAGIIIDNHFKNDPTPKK